MPKAVLFQSVNESSRHKKGPDRIGPALFCAKDYLSGGWLSQSSA